jgi:hypothetical protein
MNNQHPITPPPVLIEQWMKIYPGKYDLAAKAARWGADQELKACCVLMDEWGLDGEDLVECRRPKPPTLKEQALYALDEAESSGCLHLNGLGDTIRRALEELPND